MSIKSDQTARSMTASLLRALYKVVHEREVDESHIAYNLRQIEEQGASIQAIVESFIYCAERREKEARDHGAWVDTGYHAPTVLSRGESGPSRIAVLGSCMTDWWYAGFSQRCEVDYIQLNHVQKIPDDPPRPPDQYDFQVVQLPLRAILPERHYLSLRYTDQAAFERLFLQACERLASMLEMNLEWNRRHGLLTFVCNFFTPQQNPLGRFAPDQDLRNPVHFIRRLSWHLADLIKGRRNVHIVDINKLSGIYGAKYHQDDALHYVSHHGLIADYEDDRHRIEPPIFFTRRHVARRQEFVDAIWEELCAMYRTIRGDDAVKLVIIDLDDTLWRGVAADGALDTFGEKVREGWPIGMIEALWYLKSRGILLAIASRNDEGRVRELWSDMTGDLISLDDFAVVKINWRPKVDNVSDILELTRILPKSVLFIDDNPVERAAVTAAWPEIRVLGRDLYDIRRVLLWSPELQTPVITHESAHRTEMIQAQVTRETLRRSTSREDFLASLKLEVSLTEVGPADEERGVRECARGFVRAFELINKTSQFNTTGRRWKREEIDGFLRDGGVMLTFEVRDSFTRYGLVGVVLVRADEIVQWTMSCRILGLDVEFAVLRAMAARFSEEGHAAMRARLVGTDHNFICRQMYQKAGFECVEGTWIRPLGTDMGWPDLSHVHMVQTVQAG